MRHHQERENMPDFKPPLLSQRRRATFPIFLSIKFRAGPRCLHRTTNVCREGGDSAATNLRKPCSKPTRFATISSEEFALAARRTIQT